MLIVETIAKIRRAYFVEGKSIKAICRDLRVSRKVVRKVIRSGETAFSYERSSQPQPKIGPWREELDKLLVMNAKRSSRERLTHMRISRICAASAMRAVTMPCAGMQRRGGGGRAKQLLPPSCH